MKKLCDKIINKVDKNWTNFSIGSLIILLAVFGCLSYAPTNDYFIYVSKFFTWTLSFLFGSILTYVVYFILILVGIRVIIGAKHNKKITMNMTIFGFIFITVGSLILISNSLTMDNGTYLTFNNFETVFNDDLIANFPNVNTFSNSGIIGMFLVALINSGMTEIGSYVIGSVLLVIGTVFAFAKLTIKFSKNIAEYFNQTFGKNVLKQQLDFKVAKDITYDTGSIKKVEEEKEEQNSEPLQESTFNMSDAHSFEAKPVVEENNDMGLVKAVFVPTKDKQEETKNDFARFDELNVSVKSIDEVENNINVEVQETFEAPVLEETNNEIETPYEEQNEIRGNKVYSTPFINVLTSINEQKEEPTFNEPQFVNNGVNAKPLAPILDKAETNVMKEEVKFIEPQKEVVYSNKIEVEEEKPKPKPRKTYEGPYVYPSITLLEDRQLDASIQNENIVLSEERKEKINQIFDDLGVGAQIVGYTIGPSVTQFDIKTDKNVSVNSLKRYIDDISVRLGGLDTRFEPIVLGKSTSGLEIANAKSKMVNFKTCFAKLNEGKYPKLAIPFGEDISGKFIAADLADFPHLLVCGTTGSGKSIFMHSVIMSLIMRNSIDELKMIMIDPKKVEFGKYKEMPHLLCPPINDSNKAYLALLKLCDEMDNRYTLFEMLGVSNIKQYNKEMEANGGEKMPYIVLVCDEFADLMDTNRKCSEPVVRIGQKARAAGIHMIIATQRPSTNVITGTIKANLPTRVALSCSSSVDSVTILGEGGAEKLLGNGDMLVMCNLISKQGFVRVQGAFVDNSEIRNTVNFLKEKYPTIYNPIFLNLEDQSHSTASVEEVMEQKEKAMDEKYQEVKAWVMDEEYTSISKIQRTFGFGFPRAGKIFERLANEGIISDENEPNNSKGRKVLVHHEVVKEQSTNPGSSEVTTMDYSKQGDF